MPRRTPPTQLPASSLHWLITIAIVTVILWQIPSASLLLYPFAILSTWFHEAAHGIAALLSGGHFRELRLYPDGSGIALYSYYPGTYERLALAFIAAAGPLGPPIAGALFILAGRRASSATFALILLASALLLSALLWIRTPFGIIAVLLLAAAIGLTAFVGSPAVRAFSSQFLGIQACVSTYKQIDYLFMSQAEIDGKILLSDTMQIQQQLLLPYWFWGVLIILLSLALLFSSLWLAYREQFRRKRR